MSKCVCVCVREISGLKTGGGAQDKDGLSAASLLFSSLSSVAGFGTRGSGMSSFPACTAALRVTSV